MIQQYSKQAGQLWKANPLFSIIAVLATALTITFVMVLYMVYAFRTTDMNPEINRSRTLYSGRGYSYMSKDRSQSNTGMSYTVAKNIFGGLQHAETVSYLVNKGEGAGFVGTSRANFEKKIVSPVDDNYFRIFSFNFIAGGPFTPEQADAVRREAIITDKVAMQFFNTTNVIGKNIMIMFTDYKITGVVQSVSSLFNKAYSDVWTVADKNAMNWGPDYSEGLLGNCLVAVTAKKGSSLKALQKEIDENITALNNNLREFTFEQTMHTQAQANFFEGDRINPIQIFIILILILLIVPAINMSGLLSTQMKKRSSEIGIRKSYGASNVQIGGQLLFENLLLTLAGGIIGLLLSIITVLLFKNTLLGDIMTVNVMESFRLPLTAFFKPLLFVSAFVFSLFINLLSAVIPVWNVSRTAIIETIKGE
ncbi:MAG: ABC transporter permease [Proteiniphilum sp.]|jgi:putative ABC transport system permease protein|nr:ABC transporter permease [Proteiniphilum sp.]